MIEILPSILTSNNTDYGERISQIEKSGVFDDAWIHIDFMDNQFVPNKSVEIDVLKLYPSNFHIEAHLMVVDAEDWAQELVESGVERIIFHVETIDDDELMKKIKAQDVEIGLAINLETPVAKLIPFMDTIDVVLVMAIKPGFSGQEFIPDAKEKIKEVSDLRSKENLDFRIEVDGGVTAENIAELERLGADGVTMASHLLEGDIHENLEKIWEKYEEDTKSA